MLLILNGLRPRFDFALGRTNRTIQNSFNIDRDADEGAVEPETFKINMKKHWHNSDNIFN